MKKANPEVPNFSVIQKKCGDTRPIPEPEDNLYNNCTCDESVSFDEAFVKKAKKRKIVSILKKIEENTLDFT